MRFLIVVLPVLMLLFSGFGSKYGSRFLHVRAFKAEEFKNCDDAHFCKRQRNRPLGNSSLFLISGEIRDGQFLGKVGTRTAEGIELVLEISAISGNILRFKLNEAPEKGRFQVPDVLEPDLEGSKVPLTEGEKKHIVDVNSVPIRLGRYNAVLKKRPLGLEVYDGDVMIMALNGKGLFDFEHLREKREGDEVGLWEESFRSHHDSKPKGPEAIGFDFSFKGFEHVYGIPQHATSLSLKPTKGPGIASEPYRLYNLDVFEYLPSSPFGLYGSIPFMTAHSTLRTAGLFWLNSAEMWVDVMAPGWDGEVPSPAEKQVDTHWISESGIVDLFLLLGPSPKDVSAQYAKITGGTAMPQMFAIAYHQCRWNYNDEADVEMVDENFDHHDIPYDVLWLDIEHTDGKRYMTWDSNRFPHPVEMQKKLAAKGRKMVAIVDPHVKRDDGYALHREATEKGYYVKNSHGSDFDGWCWPGSSSYLDVVDPKIRQWWAEKFSYESYVGSTPNLYIWNDMNEPSVFNGPEVTMQKDNLHYGGVEHRDVHNVYGYYYHLATANGLLHRSGGSDRPFVLSRAIFAGTQKVGPIWTGDNTAEWSHLRVSIPMLLSLGLSGIAFSGADVGGFFGDPDAELMLRWYQLGVFYPFFRAHAHLDTKRREPWLFGEPYTSLIREAVRMRYAHLPYLYTLFRHAATSGLPVMRPLWMEFPSDASTFSSEESFLLGPALFISPVLDQGAKSISISFPGSDPWYDIKSGAAFAVGSSSRVVQIAVGLETMPVFQRGGSIIPRKDRARRSSAQMELDPYTLVVALNSSLEAEGELYIDDGKSYEFKSGAFLHRHFFFTRGRLHSVDAAPPGTSGIGYSTPCFVERIVVMGLPSRTQDLSRRALIEKSDVVLEEEAGPAWLRSGTPDSVLVVRSPKVSIRDDWTIKIFD